VANNSPKPNSTEQSLAIGPHRIELDNGQQGEEVHGQFTVANNTDRPIRYRALAGCTCTHLHPDEKEVLPHETESVGFGIKLPDLEGAEKELSIRVINPADSVPYGTVHIVARTKTPLLAQPRLVDFGFIRKSQVKDAKVTVQLFDHDHRPITSHVIVQLEMGRKGIDVRTVDRKPLGTRIELCLKPDAPIGDVNDRLLVQVEGIKGTIHLPVLGRLVGELCARPPAVFLGTAERQSGRLNQQDFIIARTDPGASIGKVLGFEPSVKGVQLIDETASGLAPFRQVRIQVADRRVLGITTRLAIRVQGLDERVPLTVVNLPALPRPEARATTSNTP
jgi:hypothetical protein